MSEKVIYLGIFLTNVSKKRLLERFPAVHPNVHADHVTLKFKPNKRELAQFIPWVGQAVDFTVHGHKADKFGQAALVNVFPFQCANAVPHITISCANGVKPVYSNDMLSPLTIGDHFGIADMEMVLTGIFDTFPRQAKK